MPRVKVDYVVSFSNEDPEHPASNLLSWEVGKRRWLCRAGEPTCSAVLQLTRAVQISAIQIGSYHAAVVEVLVGRSETPDAPFEVLVPSSVFLTPAESRRDPVDRVRSFSGDQLAPAATQRWDRVRVVCRQPYNKQCKYGLSFIQIYEPESTASTAPSTPLPAARAIAASTNFGNSSSDEEDYRPGQLFAAARGSASTSTGSQIRQATSQILKNMSESSPKIVKSPIVKNTASTSKQNVTDEPSSNRHRDSLMYTDEEDKPHSKIDSVVQRHHSEKAKEKEAREAKEKLMKEKKEKDNAKQLDSLDNKTRNDHEGAKKDDRAGDNSAKKDDRSRRDDFNLSRNDRGKKDDNARRNDHKNKYGDDQRAKRDDRSKEDQNRHKRNDNLVRPGRSDDKGDTRSKDKTTPFKKGGDSRGDQQRTATKRARPSDSADGELRAGPVSSSPHMLLSNAALVLSGYVHPRRGHIRAAATALGARVLPDWGTGATHLICAFPNTPKLRQALASNPQTPIATGDWVEKCCELRRLLPWQWFATEPARRVPMPDLSQLPDGDAEQAIQEEDWDTDDEIERVLREQKKRRRSSTPNTEVGDKTNKKDDSTDDVEFVRDERIKGRMTVHDSDTEEDKTINASRSDDEGARVKRSTQMDVDSDGDATEPEPGQSPGRKHSPLPNFLDGHTFYIDPEVSTAGLDAKLLARYVRAYGGVLVEKWSEDDDPVDFVLCASDEQTQTCGRHVRADWLWRCHAERRLCSPDRYLVRPADT